MNKSGRIQEMVRRTNSLLTMPLPRVWSMAQQHWHCLEEASDAKAHPTPDLQASILILSQWGAGWMHGPRAGG